MLSRNYIETLTLQVAAGLCDLRALGELIFALRAYDHYVPQNIATVMVERPLFWDSNNPFPGRLAFGVLNESLQYLDANQQSKLIRLYQRQINLIKLTLLEIERDQQIELAGPSLVLTRFGEHFKELRLASTAISELAENEQLMPAELATLLEAIIVSSIVQPELIRLLLSRMSSGLNRTEKTRLASRAEDTIEKGLNNEPIEGSEDTILSNLTEIRFQRHFFEDEQFRSAAKKIVEITAEASSKPIDSFKKNTILN
jgi:hypothetical protein